VSSSPVGLVRAACSGPLGLTERVALGLAVVANEWRPLKRVTSFWRQALIARVVEGLVRPRLRVLGLEHVERLAPRGGVLLAANHRSFFDLFVVASCLREHTKLCQSVYFPVRSRFWYDHPLGPLVNAVGTGMSMFPPVFRAGHQRPITRRGLDLLAERLARPGVVVGMHPEGTRSRGPDPYELLPAEQSFGRVALLARPTVIPAFVSGLSNSLVREVSRRHLAGAEISVVFGPPVDLSEFSQVNPQRLRHQIAVGERVLSAIDALGRIERAARPARPARG
jgi:1-acyl-sn-glycerol-3-phosphate acyltransferase